MQQRLHERASVLRCTYIACLVKVDVCMLVPNLGAEFLHDVTLRYNDHLLYVCFENKQRSLQLDRTAEYRLCISLGYENGTELVN
jgi:hypothetical protein